MDMASRESRSSHDQLLRGSHEDDEELQLSPRAHGSAGLSLGRQLLAALLLLAVGAVGFGWLGYRHGRAEALVGAPTARWCLFVCS